MEERGGNKATLDQKPQTNNFRYCFNNSEVEVLNPEALEPYLEFRGNDQLYSQRILFTRITVSDEQRFYFHISSVFGLYAPLPNDCLNLYL